MALNRFCHIHRPFDHGDIAMKSVTNNFDDCKKSSKSWIVKHKLLKAWGIAKRVSLLKSILNH